MNLQIKAKVLVPEASSYRNITSHTLSFVGLLKTMFFVSSGLRMMISLILLSIGNKNPPYCLLNFSARCRR